MTLTRLTNVRPKGAKDPAWEPVDLVHGRVDERGIISSFVSNRDLLNEIGREVVGGFSSREVFTGARSKGVSKYTRIYLSVASGGTSQLEFQIPVNLSNHTVRSATGMTSVHAKQSDITTVYGTNLPHVPEEGNLVAGLQIGNDIWQVWGSYNLAEQRGEDLATRVTRSVRRGTGRLTRRALGREEVIRVTGVDQNRVQAVIEFRRMSQNEHGNGIYQVQSITMTVPDTGGQDSITKDFMRATELNVYMPNPVSPVVKAAETVVETAEETADDIVQGLRAFTGMESSIATAVTLSRTDPENRVHVAALVNAVAAKQEDLKALFQEEELMGHPEDVKIIQQELTEVSRIRSVLETHLNTLAAEASGEKELENISRYGRLKCALSLPSRCPIPSDVHAAIGQSHSSIGVSARDWWTRRSQTGQDRKWAKTASVTDLKAAFVRNVRAAQRMQSPTGAKSVGSHFIRRAHLLYEELSNRPGYDGDADTESAHQDLINLEAREKEVRKTKHALEKQQAGKARTQRQQLVDEGQ